jgi:hypothetical protein
MTSQINPNNIDGSYPVAGQDNNSQGFRDNFTNIKVNFQDAAAEITDLQNKVVLKAALTGIPLDNNMNDALLLAAKIQDFSATKVTVENTSGAIAINYISGHYQSIATSGPISLSFINWPGTGSYGYIKLQINIQNVSNTVTLPGAVSLGTSGLQGYNAGTITFSAIGIYEFGFGTYDGGTTITIFDLNRGLTNFAGADIQFDDITATGNISAGNVSNPRFISASGNVLAAQNIVAVGNVTGGNIISGASVSAASLVASASISTAGTVSATGNITASNLVGLVRPPAGSASQAPLVFTSGSNLSVPAPGAFEYDGVVFYSTPQATAQRGVVPTVYVLALSTDYLANDSSSAQQVFNVGTSTAGTVTLADSTTYMFEGTYYLTRAAGTNSHTTSLLFSLSNPLTSITYHIDSTTSTGVALTAVNRIYATSVSATVATGSSTSATENLVFTIKGILRTNASTTLQPQFQYSSAPGGSPTVLKNSYIKFVPIGTSSVTTVGNW